MEKKESALLRVISILVTVLLILAVILCVYIVYQLFRYGTVNIGGYMMFRVVTGSMEPTMSIGTLLIAKEVNITAINVDDIVCFRTYDTVISGSVVTHRVVEIMQDQSGFLLRTKGDANLVADGYFVSQANLVGKVVWFTGDESLFTRVFSFLSSKIGFLGCIVLPCLLIAGMVLQGCVKNIRNEILLAEQEANETNRVSAEPECNLTDQEYQQMLERIRAELTQELLRQNPETEGEQDVGIVEEKQADTSEYRPC